MNLFVGKTVLTTSTANADSLNSTSHALNKEVGLLLFYRKQKKINRGHNWTKESSLQKEDLPY